MLNVCFFGQTWPFAGNPLADITSLSTGDARLTASAIDLEI